LPQSLQKMREPIADMVVRCCLAICSLLTWRWAESKKKETGQRQSLRGALPRLLR
jgi:hypothetical protein